MTIIILKWSNTFALIYFAYSLIFVNCQWRIDQIIKHYYKAIVMALFQLNNVIIISHLCKIFMPVVLSYPFSWGATLHYVRHDGCIGWPRCWRCFERWLQSPVSAERVLAPLHTNEYSRLNRTPTTWIHQF